MHKSKFSRFARFFVVFLFAVFCFAVFGKNEIAVAATTIDRTATHTDDPPTNSPIGSEDGTSLEVAFYASEWTYSIETHKVSGKIHFNGRDNKSRQHGDLPPHTLNNTSFGDAHCYWTPRANPASAANNYGKLDNSGRQCDDNGPDIAIFDTYGCYGWTIYSWYLIIDNKYFNISGGATMDNGTSNTEILTMNVVIDNADEYLESGTFIIEIRYNRNVMCGTAPSGDGIGSGTITLDIPDPIPSIKGHAAVDVVGTGTTGEGFNSGMGSTAAAWNESDVVAGCGGKEVPNKTGGAADPMPCGPNQSDKQYITRGTTGNTATWWFQAHNNSTGSTDNLTDFELFVNRKGFRDSTWNVDGGWGANSLATETNPGAVYLNFRDKNGSYGTAPISMGAGADTSQFGCFEWGTICKFKFPGGGGGMLDYRNLTAAQINARRFKYVLTDDDIGRTLCQRLNWWMGAPVNEGNGSGWACVYVERSYPGCEVGRCGGDNGGGGTPDCVERGDCSDGTKVSNGITPRTSLQDGSSLTVNSGETVKFNYSLTNHGPSKSLGLSYKTYVFILKNGQTLGSVGGTTQIYGNSETDWASVNCANGTGVRTARGIAAGKMSKCVVGGAGGDGLVLRVADGTKNVGSNSVIIDNGLWAAQPGDQICSYIAVNNWSVIHDAPAKTIAASNIVCAKVVKQPQLSILGADSFSGASYWGAETSTNCPSGAMNGTFCKLRGNVSGGFIGSNFSNVDANHKRGSWSQYGLMATGNNATANGGAKIEEFGAAGSTAVNFATKSCKLWFASSTGTGATADCAGTVNGDGQPTNNAGKFNWTNRVISVPKIYQSTVRTDSANAFQSTSTVISNLTSLSSQKPYFYSTLGGGAQNTTLSATTINKNQKLTLLFSGSLYITQNITASAIYNNFSEIPSLTIISGTIYIAPNVTELYGTYIASNVIHTCAPANSDGSWVRNVSGDTDLGTSSGSNTCKNQLRINGALVSRQAIRFQRTFGGEKATPTVHEYEPAEIINYTPNLFLTPWVSAHEKSLEDMLWTTESETNLPARY